MRTVQLSTFQSSNGYKIRGSAPSRMKVGIQPLRYLLSFGGYLHSRGDMLTCPSFSNTTELTLQTPNIEFNTRTLASSLSPSKLGRSWMLCLCSNEIKWPASSAQWRCRGTAVMCSPAIQCRREKSADVPDGTVLKASSLQTIHNGAQYAPLWN